MNIKKGFLLIELLFGLLLSTVLLLTITHYIIEISNIQQHTHMQLKACALLRTVIERSIAHSLLPSQAETRDGITLSVMRIPLPGKSDSTTYALYKIDATWNIHNQQHSISYYASFTVGAQ